MAYTVPSTEPDTFIAGDSVSWTRSSADFPSTDGWTLYYYFTANGQSTITVTCTASSPDYLATISPAASTAFSASLWFWTARVTNGTDTHTIATGRTTVTVNPATSTADPRSLTKRTLDAIQSAILGAASKDELSMSVDGLALSYRSLDELSRLEVRYQARYNRELGAERQARGLRDGSVINTRFTRPS